VARWYRRKTLGNLHAWRYVVLDVAVYAPGRLTTCGTAAYRNASKSGAASPSGRRRPTLRSSGVGCGHCREPGELPAILVTYGGRGRYNADMVRWFYLLSDSPRRTPTYPSDAPTTALETCRRVPAVAGGRTHRALPPPPDIYRCRAVIQGHPFRLCAREKRTLADLRMALLG